MREQQSESKRKERGAMRLRVSAGTAVPPGVGEVFEEVDEWAAYFRKVWCFAEVKIRARFEGVPDV
jgi:hypothetical protein